MAISPPAANLFSPNNHNTMPITHANNSKLNSNIHFSAPPLFKPSPNHHRCGRDVMDAFGVALVLIGPGNINQAKAFSEQTKFKGEVYADPSHSSYEALKFASGVFTTFTPRAGLKIIRSYMDGYRQDWKLSSEKDTMARGGWQQGGIIVAGPGKQNILYIHRDKEAGDDPEIAEVLKACCS